MLRIAATFLSLLFCSYVLPVSAQDDDTSNSPIEVNIEKDRLEYYLLQAFNAGQAEHRLSLNHIGLTTAQDETGFIVSGVLDGYPAQLAGLRPGDRLEEVDGTPFHPLWSFNSQQELPNSFRPDRTVHQIGFERNGTLQTVSIVPVFENLYDSYRSATLNSAQEISSGNKVIGYLKLWSASRSTTISPAPA